MTVTATKTDAMLPAEFSELEGFVDRWALATEAERFDTCTQSSIEEMQALYDAVFPRIDEIREYLDPKDIHDLDEQDTNLLNLSFSLIQASFYAEVWRQPHIPDTGAAAITCWSEAQL